LQHLVNWLEKFQKRDFTSEGKAQREKGKLEECRSVITAFSTEVSTVQQTDNFLIYIS